jgi:uncharacterized protein
MPEMLPAALVLALVFMAAGAVKGVVGMGMPTVVMAALSLMMPPVEAAALLMMPALVTNVYQMARGPALREVASRLRVMMVALCIGTPLGIGFLTSSDLRGPTLALGAVLAAYGLFSLARPALAVTPQAERKLSPLMGFATGVLTGATGVFVAPAGPYLGALGFQREELIQALGLSFTVSTVALALCLAFGGHYTMHAWGESLLAVVPALLGMWAGQHLRHRLDAEAFRKCFFGAMLLVGVVMFARAA